MERDWQNSLRCSSRSSALVHPDAPDGGSACGFSRRPPGTVGSAYLWSPLPHIDSPAARRFIWQDLSQFEYEERLVEALEQIDFASHVGQLRWLVEPFLGSESFGLGACSGIALTAQGNSRAALELAKLFVLGELYETGRLLRLLDRIPKLEIGSASLAITRGRREMLIRELRHPQLAEIGSVAGVNLSQASEGTRSSSSSETGKIIGGVLADVLMSIATARNVAISPQIPELVRLSDNLNRFGWIRAETKRAAAASGLRPAPPPPPRTPPISRPPEPDPDTFVLTADAAAIAAVLQQASQTGVPFCEECEKARLARLAGSQT